MNSATRARRPILSAIRVPVFAVAVAFAAAAALRYLWIEPERFGHACTEVVAPWWCPFRIGLIDLLWSNGLGVTSVVLLTLGLISGVRALTVAAMAAAAAGLMLYGHEWSAVGLLGGLVTLAHEHQRGTGEGEAAPR